MINGLSKHDWFQAQLTGDNNLVTRKIFQDVGLDPGLIVISAEVEAMDDAALDAIVEATTVFAMVSPDQKARVIAAPPRAHHVGGFLGNRINDGPAQKAADGWARSTPPSTSPRGPRTSSCWTGVGWCWPTARSRAAQCSATSPNISRWALHRNS